jgi:mRNA interferase MazF
VRRGDVYLVRKGDPRDPKSRRPFVVVSRERLIATSFPTVICAPIVSKLTEGLATQVEVGEVAGLKHASAILCDGLVSIPKASLTDFKGHLPDDQMRALDQALAVALGLQ